jgi:hypothetical protein
MHERESLTSFRFPRRRTWAGNSFVSDCKHIFSTKISLAEVEKFSGFSLKEGDFRLSVGVFIRNA